MQIQPRHVHRIISDLARAELASLRGEGPGAATQAGVEPQEFELLAVASAVDRMFHLDEGGAEDSLLDHPSIAGWAELVSRALGAHPHCVSFSSSGTAPPTRAVTHPLVRLEAEARRFAALLPRRKRVLALVPAHRLYGFVWTVVLPEILDIDCVDARGWTPGQVQARARGGDLVVGLPADWSDIDDQVLWAADVMGVTSGGRCAENAFDAHLRAGLVRLVDVYACSEHAGIGWRKAAGEPFELFETWERCRAEGTARGDECDADVRRQDDGECVRLPDVVAWRDDRHFVPAQARASGVKPLVASFPSPTVAA